MITWINNLISKLTEMLKEAGIYSVNRVVPVMLILLSTLLWLGTTIYLLAAHDHLASWAHYDELCTVFLTLVGICGTWLTGNKLANSKYNTASGAPGKPLTQMQQMQLMQINSDIPETAAKIADSIDKVAEKLSESSTGGTGSEGSKDNTENEEASTR